MALTLGASNASSFRNMSYLRDAKSRMDNSLLRISSGKKILTAADDPGGLALSMRLNNELTLNNTIKNNKRNKNNTNTNNAKKREKKRKKKKEKMKKKKKKKKKEKTE